MQPNSSSIPLGKLLQGTPASQLRHGEVWDFASLRVDRWNRRLSKAGNVTTILFPDHWMPLDIAKENESVGNKDQSVVFECF